MEVVSCLVGGGGKMPLNTNQSNKVPRDFSGDHSTEDEKGISVSSRIE